MFAQKVKKSEFASDLALNEKGDTSFLNKDPLLEERSDFSDFADYRKVCLPIKCGPRVGIVCTFSHKDHLDHRLDTFYINGLKNLIEYKKYIESEKFNFDVGPAYAIAAVIEDGDYSNFLLQFQNFKDTNDFEHIFQVKENGHTYHILPLKCDTAFGNVEQLGLIKFSIYKAFGSTDFIKKRNEINKLIINWLSYNNNENAKRLRYILESSKKDRFDDISRVFKNCIIYENIFEKIKTSFELESIVKKLKELSNFQY